MKLNKVREESILDNLRLGSSRRSAAELSGVSARTLQRWIKRGEEGESEEWERFAHKVYRAEAVAEGHAVDLILEAAKKGDWRAAAWWLERRHPNRWSKSQHVAIEADNSPMEIVVRIGGKEI